MTAFLVFCALLIANSALCRDFGTQGHTYTIVEPDLLKQMMQRLRQLEEDGTLARHNQKMLTQAEERVRRPAPVSGMIKTTTSRTFFYDPSLTVPFDLKDHKGQIFHKAGTRVNPLAFRSLTKSLVFIDGDDEAQVAWAAQQANAKIILTNGSPFALMEVWDHPVYFDQGGTITSKLRIRHVPALVTQEGLKLKISELVREGKP